MCHKVGLLFVLLNFFCSSLSAEQNKTVETYPEFKIVTEKFGAPLIIDLDQQTGIDPEILKIVFHDMGYKIKLTYVPFRRFIKIIDDERVEAISVSEYVKMNCTPTKPFRYWENILVVDNSVLPSKFEMPMLKNLSIGVYPLFDKEQSVFHKKYMTPAKTITYLRLQHGVRMLFRGRINAVIGDTYAMSHFYKEEIKNQPRSVNFKVYKKFPKKGQMLCLKDKKIASLFDKSLAKPAIQKKISTLISSYSTLE